MRLCWPFVSCSLPANQIEITCGWSVCRQYAKQGFDKPGDVPSKATRHNLLLAFGCRVQPDKSVGFFARTTNWHLACCNAGVPFSVHSSSSTLGELQQSGAMTCRQGFTFPDAKESTLPAYMEVCHVQLSAPATAVSKACHQHMLLR
jgi:hypothetical protein